MHAARWALVAALSSTLLGASPPPERSLRLREVASPPLQAGLEAALEGLGLHDAIREQRLSVALAGLSREECPRLAAVNGDVMMYAASLPKIAILLAVYRKAQDGELQLTAADQRAAREMIRRSSNTAATRMLDRVGRGYVNDLLQSEEYQLYDPEHDGGLWVGKPYSSEPAFERDPLSHLSHGATAIQVARFFYLLETGRLLDDDYSARLKRILGDPGIAHKFVAGIRGVRPQARLFRKSGTWREYHADAALVEYGDTKYVAVAMARSRDGERWLREIIVAVDELIRVVPPPCAADPEPGEAPATSSGDAR